MIMNKERCITLVELATAALPLSWGVRLNLLPDPAQKQIIFPKDPSSKTLLT